MKFIYLFHLWFFLCSWLFLFCSVSVYALLQYIKYCIHLQIRRATQCWCCAYFWYCWMFLTGFHEREYMLHSFHLFTVIFMKWLLLFKTIVQIIHNFSGCSSPVCTRKIFPTSRCLIPFWFVLFPFLISYILFPFHLLMIVYRVFFIWFMHIMLFFSLARFLL